MKLSEMLTAIREYPALKMQYEAMREQQASQERTAVQIYFAYNNLQIKNRKLSQKNKAMETALVKLVPRLNSREHCRRLYKTIRSQVSQHSVTVHFLEFPHIIFRGKLRADMKARQLSSAFIKHKAARIKIRRNRFI